jgi:hypothetical protein
LGRRKCPTRPGPEPVFDQNLQYGGFDEFVKSARIPRNDQLAIAEFVMMSVRRLGEIQQSRRGEVFHGGRQVRQYKDDFPP